ncbi:anti-sigma factor family protein [Nonomuraea guangzhouensis]|uniref:Anti-sigma factor family protein n=1 Tax=Nonomuraea guangzhouensis TaxID=1291555 RepID=A0ABW4GMH6_9ACTN|nr:zf-HC2 domain-containing protein [Nonomuraea guangzhouensis]
MTGDTHYDLEILAELAEGLLDAGTARQVREHLAVCDPCGELLADLAAVREVLAATPTPAMPMGVALRIDKALAAEAGSGRGGVGLAEAPNWDELMRDSPWVPGNDPQQPEPVRLGVVSDDGTIVPAGRKAARRRRWAMPAVAAAAAAAVVGTAVISTNLFSGGGTVVAGQQGVTTDAPAPTTSELRAKAYALTDSGHNYSDQELKQPLENFFGPAPIVGGGSSDVDAVDKCVNRVANRTKLKVFAVDQGQYNGQEAVIMTSWKNKSAKTLRIDIVDPFNCKNLRKPTVGSW